MKFQTLKYSLPLRNIPKDNPQQSNKQEESKTVIQNLYDCFSGISNRFNYLYEKYIKKKEENTCRDDSSYIIMNDNKS